MGKCLTPAVDYIIQQRINGELHILSKGIVNGTLAVENAMRGLQGYCFQVTSATQSGIRAVDPD